MRPLPHVDPESQLASFREAVQLLGGVRSAARELNLNDRTLYSLIYAKRDLHDGYLRDMAAALIRHADQCRALERLISPAFVGNLTAEQQTAKPHGNRYDQRGTALTPERAPFVMREREGKPSLANRKDRNDG